MNIDVESGAARSTWGAFDRLLKRSQTFQRETDVAFDETVPEARRLTALNKLRERLAQDPARQLIRARLGRDRGASTWVEEFTIQTTILSTRAFDWMTPVHSQHHVLFVPLVCLVATYFFRYVLLRRCHLRPSQENSRRGCRCSYMTGAYPAEFAMPGCLPGTPLTMIRWMGGSVGAPGWCLPGSAWQFSAPFLRRFGGRYDPDMKARPYEWLTGPFLHQH
ncbi:MAG: hypothetical protein EOO40_11725, partial [Deltaproteobacteria bacterium]